MHHSKKGRDRALYQNKYPIFCKSNNQVVQKKNGGWVEQYPSASNRNLPKTHFISFYFPLNGITVSPSDKKKPEMVLQVAEM